MLSQYLLNSTTLVNDPRKAESPSRLKQGQSQSDTSERRGQEDAIELTDKNDDDDDGNEIDDDGDDDVHDKDDSGDDAGDDDNDIL